MLIRRRTDQAIGQQIITARLSSSPVKPEQDNFDSLSRQSSTSVEDSGAVETDMGWSHALSEQYTHSHIPTTTVPDGCSIPIANQTVSNITHQVMNDNTPAQQWSNQQVLYQYIPVTQTWENKTILNPQLPIQQMNGLLCEPVVKVEYQEQDLSSLPMTVNALHPNYL